MQSWLEKADLQNEQCNLVKRQKNKLVGRVQFVDKFTLVYANILRDIEDSSHGESDRSSEVNVFTK